MARISRRLAPLGPLAPVAGFLGLYFSLFSISRLLLTLGHISTVAHTHGAWWLFPIGLRMDSMILSAAVLLPTLLLLLLPPFGARLWQPLLATVFALLGGVMTFIEIATYPFMDNYGSRPNQLSVEYLDNPNEVLGILLAGFKLELVIGLLLTLLAAWVTGRFTLTLMQQARPWRYRRRLIGLPIAAFVLALGVRSSVSDSPANLGTAAFSNDQTVNELAMNSSYAVTYFSYKFFNQQTFPVKRYGQMPRAEIIARVRKDMALPASAFNDPQLPTVHTQTPAVTLQRPRNLVIILSESLSAEFIGTLGGAPVSPRFDALSREGILFTNLFAIGTRTNRGVSAVLTGALPIPMTSAIKLRLAQSNFFTLPGLLKQYGYHTSFIYGGDSNFDNMQRFLSYNGVDRTIEQSDISNAHFRNHWGVSDEDTFAAANQLFRSYGDEPFASLVLTLSNHEPFAFPDGDYQLYEQPRATHNNSAKYADYALGKFFDQARHEAYFDNTVFLIVADHGINPSGQGLVKPHRYHIPALILGPGLTPARKDILASQIDLAPTVLGLLGLTTRHPMAGRDLLQLPPGTPGRAIYQHGTTHAYQVGDQVVVHLPGRPARQFTLHDHELQPAALDPELAKDALAHILLPDLLHREQRYGIPPQSNTR
jgi:phosphoglycerol transferase MdoB-like AlkP superfamily enzyme